MNRLECFKQAYESSKNKKYMVIALTIGDNKVPEIIINLNENFESKVNYYTSHYNDNLVHKFSKDIEIKIQKFAFTNSLDKIIKNMEV